MIPNMRLLPVHSTERTLVVCVSTKSWELQGPNAYIDDAIPECLTV
ncbi:hypothetical protein OGCDGJMD_01876 [Cyanobium usitatum str. Tous]|jgi:hypothetical protein|nr:hypothetical protein OGCDGJMD_01876 [Cyanobium usitatum str. Tous]